MPRFSVKSNGKSEKNIRFRDRNPKVIGVIGLAVCVGLVSVSLSYDRVGFINGRHSASAYVADAAGLKVGDEVQVAGIKVGTIRGMKIENRSVRIDFDIDNDVALGSVTTAAIKTDSILGRRALAVYSDGIGKLRDNNIPLNATRVPYSLTDALGDATKTIEELDTDKVARALDEVSKTMDAAGPNVKGALDGLTRLSRTLNERDVQLRELLRKSNDATSVLGERSERFAQLVNDGNLLFAALDARKRALDDLIRNVDLLAQQLSGLVQDNEAQLGPALDKVERVSDLLIKNRDNIDLSLRRIVPYATALGDAVASGPWFNAYMSNLAQPQYMQSVFHDLAPLLDPKLGPQPPLERQPGMPGSPQLNITPDYPGWGEESDR